MPHIIIVTFKRVLGQCFEVQKSMATIDTRNQKHIDKITNNIREATADHQSRENS